MMFRAISPLAVGFVTPLFAAAGMALASIPIIIHLLNRRRHKTVPWAAMHFLLAAIRQNRRRLRFEQWLLLAVRCCVLGLFGLALARPMGCDRSTLASLAGQHSGMRVIVIDNSYSMAYEADRPHAKSNLDQAKLVAKAIIDQMASGELVAVIAAARPAVAVIAEPTYDLAAAQSAVERITQTFGGTDLPGAMRLAIDLAQRHTSRPDRSLDLITDASRGAFEGPQAEELASLGTQAAKAFKVSHHDCARAGQANAAVCDIAPASRLVRSKFENFFTASPLGFGSVPAAALRWTIDDQPMPIGKAIDLSPATPVQSQSQINFQTGGFHVIAAALTGGDRLTSDDVRYRVVDVISQLRVLIVEGQRGVGALGGSGAFLSLALAPPSDEGGNSIAGHERTSSYVQPELISDLELSNKALGDYRAIVLAGVGQPTEQQAEQLKGFVQAGGTLLLFMGEAVNGQAYNATLLPRGLLPGPLVQRVNSAGDPKPFLFDFNPSDSLHPLLSAFRNQEKSGLDTAAVLTYWKIDPAKNTQRVLDYRPDEKGQRDPAITAHDLGAGHVVFVSTTANSDWTFLPAKPAYVALMHELLAGSIRSGDDWLNKTVGDRLEIPSTLRLTGPPTLNDSQQTPITLSASEAPFPYKSDPLSRPGIYTLNTGSATFPVAVNLPAAEADIRPLEPAALAKALGNIPLSTFDDSPPVRDAAASMAGNDFGWTMMCIVLIGLAAECVLALRFGHRSR